MAMFIKTTFKSTFHKLLQPILIKEIPILDLRWFQTKSDLLVFLRFKTIKTVTIEIPKPKAKKTITIEIQEPNSPKPMSYQPKLPYPERMKIGLKDALVEMPKFNKWLKLEEIAITTVNAECSAIIMNKVPEKLEDPGKFLIPCALQELDRT
ncbi:hypothetical protein Tco_0075051, partial [Tanacetum coccineum]